jgi:BirA family biotin operon repressor/biotin-[acetyl-CoA-carboxylase] ligase
MIGSSILWFDSLTSSNDLAREMAETGAAEGTVIIALSQTAGRGRAGRQWFSPRAEGLYLSVVLRPDSHTQQISLITLLSSIAVAESLRNHYDVPALIKWPNDILVNKKKISGSLVETASCGDTLKYAVLGVGVNLSQHEFPPEMQGTATSLWMEKNISVTVGQYLPHLLERLNYWYPSGLSDSKKLTSRWEELSDYAYGRQVSINTPDGVVEGVTRGLRNDGALRVEMPDGSIREVVTGDVAPVSTDQ